MNNNYFINITLRNLLYECKFMITIETFILLTKYKDDLEAMVDNEKSRLFFRFYK